MTIKLTVPEYIYCYRDKDHLSNESRSSFDCKDQEEHQYLSSPAQVTADSNREYSYRKCSYQTFTSDNKRYNGASWKYHGNDNWESHFHRREMSKYHEIGRNNRGFGSQSDRFPHPQNDSPPFRRWDYFERQHGQSIPPCRRVGFNTRHSFQEQYDRRSYHKESIFGNNQESYPPPNIYNHNRMKHRQRKKINHCFGYSRDRCHPNNSHRRTPSRGCTRGSMPPTNQTFEKGHQDNRCTWNGRGYKPGHSRP